MGLIRQFRIGFKQTGSILDVDTDAIAARTLLPGPYPIDTTGATLGDGLQFNGSEYVPGSASAGGAGTAYTNAAVAITTNQSNLSSVSTSQDGYTIAAGDRVLLTGQTTASENGIYVAGTPAGSAVALTRATDMPAAATLTPGSSVFVLNGTVYGATRFTSIGASGAVGTVAQTWQAFWLGSDGAISLPDARITATAGITAWDTWNAARRTLLTMSSVGSGIGDTSPTAVLGDGVTRVHISGGTSVSVAAGGATSITAIGTQLAFGVPHLPVQGTLTALGALSDLANGMVAYCTNARVGAETAGNGTGCLAQYKTSGPGGAGWYYADSSGSLVIV